MATAGAAPSDRHSIMVHNSGDQATDAAFYGRPT